MKKLIIPILLGLVFFLQPLIGSAATVCWTDGTSFFVFAGGKVNLKPFSGEFVSPTLGCHGTLWGSIVTIGPGVEAITIEGNLPAPCINFIVSATSGISLNASGVFDNLENATSDGAITLTPISCDSVPSMAAGPKPAPPPHAASAGVPATETK